MTVKDLSQLYWLNREIEREREHLRELEASATNGTTRITGLPYAGAMSDKTALWAAIADTRAAIEAKINLSVVEYNKLSRYIATVDDSLMRQILTLRFVEGMSWRKVARSIGGGNTEDSVKQACSRFLRKDETCHECHDPM